MATVLSIILPAWSPRWPVHHWTHKKYTIHSHTHAHTETFIEASITHAFELLPETHTDKQNMQTPERTLVWPQSQPWDLIAVWWQLVLLSTMWWWNHFSQTYTFDTVLTNNLKQNFHNINVIGYPEWQFSSVQRIVFVEGNFRRLKLETRNWTTVPDHHCPPRLSIYHLINLLANRT